MPKFTIPLVANHDAISRPIISSIARKVTKLCNLPQADVHFAGEFGTGIQPGSAMGDRNSMRFESDSRFTVTGIDQTINEHISQLSIRTNDYPPVWEDQNLGISIRPVYVSSEVTLAFQYIAGSHAEAIKWRDEYAIRRAEGRWVTSHEVQYDIPVHDAVLGLLEHLHGLRENIDGYGDTFPEYFNKHMTRKWVTLATQDMDEEKFLLAVPERQKNLGGTFDFSDVPRENKVDGNVTYEIEFSYRMTYLRCTHLYITYPLVVHQQHIGVEYFDPNPRYRTDELPNGNSSIAIRALDAYDGVGLLATRPYDGYCYPTHDEWIPAGEYPAFTKAVMTWMIGLDPKKPQDFFDLNDFPEMRLTLEMVNYLKACGDDVFTQGRSAVHLQVWAGDFCMEDGMFTIDENLKIRSKQPTSLKTNYHLRMAFNTDYGRFTSRAKRLMYDHPYATLQIFKSIYPSLNIQRAVAFFTPNGKLPYDYIEWFFNHIRHKNLGITPTVSDFLKDPWHHTGEVNDPAIGSGSTWRGGENHPGELDKDSDPKGNILPDNYKGTNKNVMYVQYLAIMTSKRACAS